LPCPDGAVIFVKVVEGKLLILAHLYLSTSSPFHLVNFGLFK
jgi:hypothetical protein